MSILDLLYPKKCVNCGAGGRYVCRECAAGMARPREVCPYCARYSYGGLTHKSCVRKYGLAGKISLWRHEDAIKKAIWALKYKFAHDLGDAISGLAVNALKSDKRLEGRVFVPIPLHKRRANWRGFNQAAEVGSRAARALKMGYFDDFLVRNKGGQAQVGLSKKERARNIGGKYAVKDAKFAKSGKIILFDDVWTTGATMREAGKVVARAGYADIWALTLAA